MSLTYDRVGSGPPMLLIHGVGGFGRHWEPVVPGLAEHFDLIAPDLPGFGRSPALPGDRLTARMFADALVELLDSLDIEAPHVVGHSMGGYVALEVGALRRAATVTGIAPAGLWREHQSRVSTTVLRGSRLVAGLTRPVARPFILVGSRVSPARLRGGVPAELALASYDAYSTCAGFTAALRGTTETPFLGKDALAAPPAIPVTIAFGTRDRVILPQDRSRDRLPDHARWVDLPGLGHSPQWQRPDLVVQTILDATGYVAAGSDDGGTDG